MIMNTFVKLYFENNVFTINSELLKFKYIEQLVDQIANKLENSNQNLFQNVYGD